MRKTTDQLNLMQLHPIEEEHPWTSGHLYRNRLPHLKQKVS